MLIASLPCGLLEAAQQRGLEGRDVHRRREACHACPSLPHAMLSEMTEILERTGWTRLTSNLRPLRFARERGLEGLWTAIGRPWKVETSQLGMEILAGGRRVSR